MNRTKLFILGAGSFLLFASHVDAGRNIIINELLPNPEGDDRGSEFVELYNPNNFAVSVGGFTLRDKSNVRPKSLAGSIKAKGYYVFKNNFLLNNQGDSVTLSDKFGKKISSVSYTGSVSEGKSYSNVSGRWAWGEPSPGKKNEEALEATASTSSTPQVRGKSDYVPIKSSGVVVVEGSKNNSRFAGYAVCMSALIFGLLTYIYYRRPKWLKIVRVD